MLTPFGELLDLAALRGVVDTGTTAPAVTDPDAVTTPTEPTTPGS